MIHAFLFEMNEVVSYMTEKNKTVFAIIRNIRRNYYPSHKPPTTEYFLVDLCGQNLHWVKEMNLIKVDDKSVLDQTPEI